MPWLSIIGFSTEIAGESQVDTECPVAELADPTVGCQLSAALDVSE
jgi:hypothetical protein